jgi:hypothetical protein
MTAKTIKKISNAFIGRTEKPSEAGLGEALGPAKAVWDELIAHMAAQGVTTQEWKSYSIKHGWALRLLRGKRTILWLAPFAGCFEALFILGAKAVAAAKKSDLSTATLKVIEEAPKYPEGTGVRLLIKRPSDIPAVKKLAVIKLEN